MIQTVLQGISAQNRARKLATVRPAAPAVSNSPAMAEEKGNTMDETNPSGITHKPIMGTTVRLAGRATGEKRWK